MWLIFFKIYPIKNKLGISKFVICFRKFVGNKKCKFFVEIASDDYENVIVRARLE